MTTHLFRHVQCIDPDRPAHDAAPGPIVDLLIQNGQPIALAPNLEAPADAQIQPQSSLILGPGLTDLYSQSGEPGHEPRETLDSLCQAAQAGGFTQVNLLPNTDPTIDSSAPIAQIRHELERLQTSIKIGLWGAATIGLKGEQLSELGELASQVVGFSDGRPLEPLNLVRRVLDYAQPLGKPVMLWPADRSLIGNAVAREGPIALQLGLIGAPVAAETAPLSAILELVATIGTPVHLMRISTARSIELIAQAQAAGLPVTASTTWMHLLWDSNHLASYDPNLRLKPPLGNPSDRQALINAVETGTLSAIAVDHSPYRYDEKTVAFAEAPAGAIGLELALPLLWQLVTTGTLSAPALWRSLSNGPRACLGLSPDQPPIGSPDRLTDLVLLDPSETWTVEAASLQSRSANTPWLGRSIQGKVLHCWPQTLT
jgi:dihydroorotase